MTSSLNPTVSAKGLPWGSNEPTLKQRIMVAFVLASIAAALNYFRAAKTGGYSDFTYFWYGAQMLLEGRDPYQLIGPGKLIHLPAPLFSPAPAWVTVMPLTLLSFHLAGALFIFISTFLLAWGVTADGWQRLPIFPSFVFLSSAQLGQWSILLAAAVFLPAVALVAVARPQSSIAVVGSSPNRGALIASLLGGFVLLAISFVLMPGWFSEWRQMVGSTNQYVAPIARTGGIAIAVVLIRWRRSDAWLVLIAACIPQTSFPYNGLLLLLVAETYREACVLSLFSSAGWMMVSLFLPGEMRSPATQASWGEILLATSYLPAVIIVLRRPNRGPSPWWLQYIEQRFKRQQISANLAEPSRQGLHNG